MISHITISGRKIGPGFPAYVIAEMSANHNQHFAQAEEIVRAAKEAGADAIKLQTYTADTITIDCSSPHFQIGKGSLWEGKNLYGLYGEAFTPWDWQPRLKRVADSLGLTLFSSPFDNTAVDFLEAISVPAYKIASFELVDNGLLSKVAATGKPVIMSTGMASLGEIDAAVSHLRAHGCTEIALLKCTSAYPASAHEINLRTIPNMAEVFHLPVGLSDHTLGVAVPVAAVTIGAHIIEKHLTLSRANGGVDSAFSLEPGEFKTMVDAIRVAELSLGTVSYSVTEKEKESRRFRRSLFVVQDIRCGEPFTESNVRSIRPAGGLSPRHLETVLGCRAVCSIEKGTPLNWSLVANPR